MRSSDSFLGWRVVDNTVSCRMVNRSLIHRLIPYKKLRKRTKALNTKIKSLHNIIYYSQYVNIKTSVEKNLSEDGMTEDSESFSETDYAIHFKSNVPSTKRAPYTSNTHVTCLHTEDDKTREENAPNTLQRTRKRSKIRTMRKKSKVLDLVGLGWQSVIKESNCVVGTISSMESQSATFPEPANHEQELESSKRIERKDTPAPNDRASFIPVAVADERKEDKSPSAELNVNSQSNWSSSLQAPAFKCCRTMLKANGKHDEASNRDKSPTHKPLKVSERDNSKSIRNAKEDFTNSFNISQCNGNDFPSGMDEFCPTNISRECSSTPLLLEGEKKLTERTADTIRVASQPKDSGIDEDSQEESSEDRRIDEKPESKRTADGSWIKIRASSPASDHLDNVTLQTFKHISPNGNTTLLETTDLPGSRDEDETHGHKLQPKVTCTEIVSKKYKIISEESHRTDCTREHDRAPGDSFNDESTRVGPNDSPNDSPNFTKHEDDPKDVVVRLSDVDELEEGSMSAFTKKRLQQLRRLNLTVSDDSSSSYDVDDEDVNVDKQGALQPKKNSWRPLEIETKRSSTAEDLRVKSRRRNADSGASGDDLERVPRWRVSSKDWTAHVNDTDESPSTRKKKKRKRRRTAESRDQSHCSSPETSVARASLEDETEREDDDVSRTKKAAGKQAKIHNATGMGRSNLVPEKLEIHEDQTGNSIKFEISEDSFKRCSRLCVVSNHSIEKADDTDDADERWRKRRRRHAIQNRMAGKNLVLASPEIEGNRNGERIYFANSEDTGAARKRPHNLQEMIELEGLTETTYAPSIFFQDIDIDEEDVFVFDIPRTVLETQLVGERMQLTGKKLRIGMQQKYEIFYKNVDSVSCVFGTGKSRKPWKTVNIKPFATLFTGKKIEAVSQNIKINVGHAEDPPQRVVKRDGEKAEGEKKKRKKSHCKSERAEG